MAFTHPTAQKVLSANATQGVTPPPAYVHNPTLSTSVFDYENDDDDDDESLSSITLRINTPLTVRGDGNLVAVDATLSATKIAVAVVNSLRHMSMGEHGIPMIDENGRPRPIKVEVQAHTSIDGSKNVVGERSVMAVTIGCGRRAGESAAHGGASCAASGAASGSGIKRPRAESEPADGEGKRVRTE